MVLNVFSIFESIQGESRYQGFPCTFVRLAGCPLECRYCDTREACESDGTSMTVDDIVARVVSADLPLVEITGGEPLLQPESVSLLQTLSSKTRKVLLETSGAFSVEGVDPRVHIVMDIKCPGSGMSDRFFRDNLWFLPSFSHELKFVLSSKDDFLWALDFCRANGLLDRHLLFSPVTDSLAPSDLAGWLVDRRLNARLQLQLHKVIWPEDEEER